MTARRGIPGTDPLNPLSI